MDKNKRLIRISDDAKKVLEETSKVSGVKAIALASSAIKIALSEKYLKETLIQTVLENL